MRFRDYLTCGYFLFILLWFGIWGYIISVFGLTAGEALGVGTATGIFLKGFGDIITFYYRKKPKDEVSQ